jgi:hypothetical protein
MKKLVIPPHLKQWIKPEIAVYDGEVFPAWTQEFAQTGWLVDVPESVILSAEEMLEKLDHISFDCRPDFIEYGEAMDQNGQLREWLRPEQVELREAIKDLFKGGSTLRVTKALENLKPPHERDND